MQNASSSPGSKASPGRSSMDGRPMPVYSDFSHMSTSEGGIGTVRFVVGLREENPQAIIERVFPMSKIVPVEQKEEAKPKKKPKKPAPVVEDKNCLRPDCAVRKEKLATMKDENKGLRANVKALEGKVETARNKIALNEKSIILAEERNDVMNGQIEDAHSKIQTMTDDVEKAESFNRALRNQFKALQDEIDFIKQQTEQQTLELETLLDDRAERKVIFSRNPRHHQGSKLALEVSRLKSAKDDLDVDSDEDSR